MLLLFDAAGENAACETLRFIEEKGRSGTWSLNVQTGECQWSSNLYALLGLQPSYVTPTMSLLRRLTHPDDTDKIAEMESVLMRAGRYERQIRIVRPDGRIRWLSLKGEMLVGKQGAPQRAIGIAIDRTEHQEQLAQIRVQSERHRKRVEAFAISTWIANSEGQIVECAGCSEFTGRPPTEGLGMSWLCSVHASERDHVALSWKAALRRPEPFQLDFRVACRNGEYRWIRTRGVPSLAEDGSVREWVGMSIEIDGAVGANVTQRQKQITGAQLRAARAFLNWSMRDLAEHANVAQGTIRRLEEFDQPIADIALPSIMAALEQHGVEFVSLPDGHTALRLRRSAERVA